ncbi:MAG: 16S rRNA (guanine(966)-N(2))-methyltransferase RsmD [Lachnospiraceae bacterium]|nr:16S rRNA (guanine(966)-N(2))-methyltransferase RsmD [Lachnospiraceae bacterium]
MRVIAGKAKSLRLKTIEGDSTRPTTDRIKETLFNMIQYDICDCVFLDLFSGSGAIGIEALSRGASECYFVENNKKAAICIKDNLAFTRFETESQVMEMDAISAINRLQTESKKFDTIFMDPPYNELIEKEVLTRLSNSDIADENTMIIVEASLDTEFDYVSALNMDIVKEKKYKTNKHIFIQKN